MQRRLMVTVLLSLMVLSGFHAVAQAGTITVRLPHCCSVDSHFQAGAVRFAELVEQKTNGRLRVSIFPGGQLGQETEVIQAVQTGVLEMTFIGHDPLAQFAPMVTLLSLPYLFESHDQAFRILEGPVGKEIEKELARRNLVVLGWGNNGARVYTNSRRPIESPADLRGLKIRSPENPINLAITRALGGTAVAIPYGEVYTAIQQGTIDGQENAVINIYPAKLQEVQRYMSMTHHLLSFTVLLVNKPFFDSLDRELQAAVREAAAEAMRFQRQHVETLTDRLVQEMQQQGMQVNWPDLEPFRAATRRVHEEYVGRLIPRELYEMVLDSL
ncbi:TRAP transporter substrate-binding protein [Geochorda subterranea]|uniref:TRAP transporter substrate-binding protein n=1 Tax=Geochorda subterranea TaxID=3109564 RepID=A0ABZ1BS64_9FIRM|nr:TRAP transporter substrate-binding protein [Limnochorda sp. LNt]WRP15647.1 TRAP transporter substrate-binding protein [Limnochorda sp. LNt]